MTPDETIDSAEPGSEKKEDPLLKALIDRDLEEGMGPATAYARQLSEDPFWPIGLCVAWALRPDVSEAVELYARHRVGLGVREVDGWREAQAKEIIMASANPFHPPHQAKARNLLSMPRSGDRLRPLPLAESQHIGFRQMRVRIVGLGDDRALRPILRTRDVAFRIDAVEVCHPNGQRKSEADHRRDKLWIEFKRALEKTDGGVLACLGGVFQLRQSTHGKIDRIRIVRPLPRRAQSLGLDELHAERIGEAGDELHRFTPEVAARFDLPLDTLVSRQRHFEPVSGVSNPVSLNAGASGRGKRKVAP